MTREFGYKDECLDGYIGVSRLVYSGFREYCTNVLMGIRVAPFNIVP